MTIIYLVMAWMADFCLASVVNLRCELWSLSALVTLIAAVYFHATGLTHVITQSGEKTLMYILIQHGDRLCEKLHEACNGSGR